MDQSEPSTSSGKRKRNTLFDLPSVLQILQNDSESDDHLSLYSKSGSEYVYSGTESDSDVSKEPVKKQAKKDRPKNEPTSTSKGQYQGKGKGKKKQNVNEEEPRHLFDTGNEEENGEEELVPADCEWRRVDPNNPVPNPNWPEFAVQSGLLFDATDFQSHDFMYRFLDTKFWELLVLETNRKASQSKNAKNADGKERGSSIWVDIDIIEMKMFIGLLLLMGIVHKPCYLDYWSKDPLLSTPVFSGVMSRNRFLKIMQHFHFNNNENEPPHTAAERDRLYKIRPLLNNFNTVFQQAFCPNMDICIDESLLMWQGRLVFKQYIPLKRARFGIKIFCLCNTFGYLYRFRVYTGKQDPLYNIDNYVPEECQQLSMTSKVTLELLAPLLNQGYHLYIDNWYNSVPLIRYLLQKQTLCTGTARSNRVPKELTSIPAKKGETVSIISGQLLAQKFMDKKTVYMMMTSAFSAETAKKMRSGRIEIDLPVSVQHYNQGMGGVDRLDQVLKPISAARKTRRWYVKLGVHLIQLAILNAHQLNKQFGDRKTFLQFSIQCIRHLIFQGRDTIISKNPRSNEQHFIYQIPATGQKANPHKRCRVCYKRGSRCESRNYCPKCPGQPGLCVGRCFELYHTKQ